jgi:inner membrane transporter RhtA
MIHTTGRQRNTILLPVVSVLVAMTSIQYGASLAKRLFPLIGAQGTTTLRLSFAALILCSLWRPWRNKLSRLEVRSILAYGVSLGAMNFLFYLAIERIPLGIAVAIEFTGPLAVALLSSRKPSDFLWAALAVAGIVLILPLSENSAPLDPLGILYVLGAGISWALYILFGQRAGASTHGGTVTALGMAIAGVLSFPIGVVHAGKALLDFSILPIAVMVAILSSAVPYSFEMIALKRLPAKNFGILMSLEPAFAALTGLVFLNEHLTHIQWLAIGSIILASIGTSASAQPQPLPHASMDNATH